MAIKKSEPYSSLWKSSETPLPELTRELETLAARVQAHLTQMGFSP